MNTPIINFVKEYNQKEMSRLHMPGHKGFPYLGCEPNDITEVHGADVLSSACGIIEESEKNAAGLFDTAHTFYSTEGSSLAIRTMLSLVISDWDTDEKRPFILAARNVHKAFLYGCALLDIDIEWLYPDDFKSLCSCAISADTVEEVLSGMMKKPAAVYLTSPDYLGFVQDIEGISKVCDKFGIPLLVDNAHGAYTRFLNPSRHPMDLGATMCSDSAHKTLPVLTGGAYLHISQKAPKEYMELARNSMALFASTSPSYLILQSLDLCNQYLDHHYKEKLAECIENVNELKEHLKKTGFSIDDTEPLKLVIDTLKSGYTGETLNEMLREHHIEAEFADPEYLVMMFTPEVTKRDYERVKRAFSSIKIKPEQKRPVFQIEKPVRHMSVRRAILGPRRTIPVRDALGQISASPSVSCPPAIPIVVSGEEITEQAIKLFEYYGIETVEIVKQ